MKVTVIKAAELDDACKSHWTELQRSNKYLMSPFFCVEFTETLAKVRDDVYVAIIEDGANVIGYFPYHRRTLGFGRPIGLGLSDYHGVIARADTDWSTEELLRGCGLVRWKFDHLVAAQTPFQSFHQNTEESPVIDVSEGFDAYSARRLEMGGGEFKTIQRRIRKLKREQENYQFIEFDTNLGRLEQVFELKSRQSREAGSYDFFSLSWTREFVRRLHSVKTTNFSGVLSSILVDGQCVATHFGIRTDHVWHWWFPCYERSFGRYSPGLILLMEIVQNAAETGFDHVDLGKDIVRYKRNLMTGSFSVATGELSTPSVLNKATNVLHWLESKGDDPQFSQLLRLPLGVVRRMRRRLKYD